MQGISWDESMVHAAFRGAVPPTARTYATWKSDVASSSQDMMVDEMITQTWGDTGEEHVMKVNENTKTQQTEEERAQEDAAWRWLTGWLEGRKDENQPDNHMLVNKMEE